MLKSHLLLFCRSLWGAAVMAAVFFSGPGVAQAQEPSSPIVAYLDGEAVELDEVDAAWRREEAAIWLRNAPYIYESRMAAVQVVIAERVLASMAAEAGQTVDEYTEELIRETYVEPTDAQVDAEVQNLIRRQAGIPEDLRRDLARIQLTNRARAEARGSVLANAFAAAENEGNVKILLSVPRLGEIDSAAENPFWGAQPGREVVTVQVFSDFTCPYCARIAPVLDQLAVEFGDRVRVAFRYFPASSRAGAVSAAEAAGCAHEQGMFDPFHDAVFANPSVAASGAWPSIEGLDPQALSNCMSAGTSFAKVQSDIEYGQSLGVNSTPTSFVNGRPVVGAVPYERLREIVVQELGE